VKVLLELKLLPRVISGTSGGAILAGMMAIKDDAELLSEVISPDIASRYGKKWFPPVMSQIKRFILYGHLMDPLDFMKTCQAYYSTWTFSEAFANTGRLVSIVVSPASRRGEPLILNCVSTPEVFIWSAVLTSCSLPGLMPPCELMAKDAHGNVVSYFPAGITWMDGSIRQDIPHKELSSLFNVKQFIVSQVNPHCAPFVNTHAAEGRLVRWIENWLTLDIKNRYAKLAKINMVPRIFGQNISTFFMMQDFEGHVTITPRASLLDWWRLINNPSVEDMEYYIREGQRRTWPHIPRIRHIMKIEQALRECWVQLEERNRR